MRRGPLAAVSVTAAVALVQQPQVVNNPAPNFRAPAFALAAAPAIVVDGNAGDSLSELFRVSDATLTPARTLIVVNNNGESIREFDLKGRFVRYISRKGEGPGEFRSISSLRVLDGDTMVFFDGTQRRITMLGPDRRHVRTITGVRRALCCTMTGGFVGREDTPFAGLGASWAAGSIKYWFGSARASTGNSDLVFSADTAPQATLPGFAAGVTFQMSVYNGRGVFATYPVPFTVSPIVRLGFDEMILGTGERFEYQVFDRRGVLIRVVRAAAPVHPVTDSMLAAHRADLAKVDPKNPDYSAKKAAAFDTIKLPRNLPAYDRLFAEEDGTVWVREYTASETLAQPWARFDRAGKLQGTLIIPPDLNVLRFSRGHAVGIVRDTTQDFQRVMAYPIVRR